MNNFMQIIGKSIITFISFIITLFTNIPEEISIVLKHFFSKNKIFKNIFFKEVYHSGIMSLPVLLVISALISSIFIQLFPFERFLNETETVYGGVFYLFIIRELTPLVVLIIIAVRSTIYITIQISQMKIGGEVETLEVLGIDPDIYLGSMRIFAGIVLCPVLGIYFVFGALIFAGITVNIFFGIDFFTFLIETMRQIRLSDFFIFIFKMSFGGYLIYKIAVYNGITAQEKRNMIISRTIRAITQSVSAVSFLAFILSVVFYGK